MRVRGREGGEGGARAREEKQNLNVKCCHGGKFVFLYRPRGLILTRNTAHAWLNEHFNVNSELVKRACQPVSEFLR